MAGSVRVPPQSLIILHDWWLVKQPSGLAVGGVAFPRKYRERVFLSTVITEREEANVLHTQDGMTILFRGLINASRSSLHGVPSQICQHFSVGFPHDWKKYSAHSVGGEDIAPCGSSDCSKRDGDALPSPILSNNCLVTEKFHIGLGSELTDKMECSVVTKTIEHECNNDGKGISAEKPSSAQSFMGTFDSNTRAGHSRKSKAETLTSFKKITRYQLSMEKQHKRPKIASDVSNSCSRMITRSMSKRGHKIFLQL